jgi:hypothetical protein
MYFKEWFEKKIKKMQIPQGESQETDNNKIYSIIKRSIQKERG